MPSITTYTAPPADLNPAERGVSAWDSAARRINAFYGDAAGYQRRQGSLAAEAEKLKLWPFDILNLYSTQAKADAAQGGARVRVRSSTGFGGPTETFADFGESRNTGAPAYAGVGQVSRGAAALGQMLSDGGYAAGDMTRGGGDVDQWGNPLAPYQQKQLDLGRKKFREFNEAMAFGERLNRMFPSGPPTELYKGELVNPATLDQYEAKERAGAAASLDKYSTSLSNYWQQFYGYQKPPSMVEDPGRELNGPRIGGLNTGYVPSSAPPQGGGWSQDLRNWFGGPQMGFSDNPETFQGGM